MKNTTLIFILLVIAIVLVTSSKSKTKAQEASPGIDIQSGTAAYNSVKSAAINPPAIQQDYPEDYEQYASDVSETTDNDWESNSGSGSSSGGSGSGNSPVIDNSSAILPSRTTIANQVVSKPKLPSGPSFSKKITQVSRQANLTQRKVQQPNQNRVKQVSVSKSANRFQGYFN